MRRPCFFIAKPASQSGDRKRALRQGLFEFNASGDCQSVIKGKLQNIAFLDDDVSQCITENVALSEESKSGL